MIAEVKSLQLEKKLAKLRSAFTANLADLWYCQITGSFVGDKAFAEIIRLGRLLRAVKWPK